MGKDSEVHPTEMMTEAEELNVPTRQSHARVPLKYHVRAAG